MTFCTVRYDILTLWQTEFARLSEQIGTEFDIFPHLEGWLQGAGFTDVETIEKPVPIGTWPKDKDLKIRGRNLMALIVDSGLEAYTYAVFLRQGEWSAADVKNLLARVSKEVMSNKMHIYAHLYVASVFSWTGERS